MTNPAAEPVPPHCTPEAWERFRRYVVVTSDHHIWVGAVGSDGYGRFWDSAYGDQDRPAQHRGPTTRVNRWVLWAHQGPLAAGLTGMHECDLPICARREHHAAGTQATNLTTAAARNRVARVGVGGYRTDRADLRGQPGQSLAIRAAVLHAVAAGTTDPDALAALVAEVVNEGDPYRNQYALFDPELT